jgi:PASTA domain-containing protein
MSPPAPLPCPGPRAIRSGFGESGAASALRGKQECFFHTKGEVFTSAPLSPKIKSAMSLPALLCGLLAMAVSLAMGCGGATTTSSTSPDPELASAKNDLKLAYRVADKVRHHGLRCSGDISSACHHPRWYPAVDAVAAAVGTEKLHRLKVAFVNAEDPAVRPGVTYVVKTRRESLVLAQETSGGTTVVLHGAPSGFRFAQVVASDWIASHASSITSARPKVFVPDVTGTSLKSAQRTLKKAKLGWRFGSGPSEGVSGSRIVHRQDPAPGSRWHEWKPVALHLHRR